MTRLNRYQRALTQPELFTVIYAIVDPNHLTMAWASGGHPPPLLRSASGETRFLDGGDPLIGMADTVYTDLSEAISPSDTLILYSDGLVERRGESVDAGLQRLSSAAARGPQEPSALRDYVMDRLLSRGADLHDDVTAMIVRVRGDSPPSPAAGRALAAA